MGASRLFVANLPQNVDKSELSEIFGKYGTVENVELKAPKSSPNDNNTKIIGFVTIKAYNVDDCINELNYVKIGQNRLKVTLAKESFLDRLKREREEESSSKIKVDDDDFKEPNVDLNLSSSILSNRNTRKVFSETNELDDDDSGLDILINKKRAASSLKNGKIVIESFSDKPVHVIENKKLKRNNDEKLKSGDIKRKQSIKNAMQQYKQKLTTVQQSLSCVDRSNSKKIIFSDENETGTPSDLNLFPDDADGDYNEDLAEKLENIDYKKAKLFNLQNEQNVFDKRFQIDDRFLEKGELIQKNKEQGENHEQTERDWQMGILEEVVGTKLEYRNQSDIKGMPKKQMLRYDPASQNQEKFLRNKEKLSGGVEENYSTTADTYAKDTNASSNEMFYVVSDTLAQSLKQPSDNAFSLLNMFGRDEVKEREQRRGLLQAVSTEKIMINNMDWNATNPFTYDSSDTDDDVEAGSSRVLKESKTNTNTTAVVKKGKSIFTEPFFFEHNDKRLQEGANFFEFENDPTADYTPVRDSLNLLIKTQINKKLKSAGRQNRKNKKLKNIA